MVQMHNDRTKETSVKERLNTFWGDREGIEPLTALAKQNSL